jgi:hypothetical protein
MSSTAEQPRSTKSLGAKARSSARMALARKGIVWKPSIQHHLGAIARARSWMDDLIEGRVGSFRDIAIRENKVERHIRRLAPLAFLSPRIVEDSIRSRTRSHPRV